MLWSRLMWRSVFDRLTWDYGRCRDRDSRRNRWTGEVQFWHEVFAESGDELGCRWMAFDRIWWSGFVSNNKNATQCLNAPTFLPRNEGETMPKPKTITRKTSGQSDAVATLSPFIRGIVRDWMRHTMSEISENHYAAGWMHNLEHVIWAAIERLPMPTEWGTRVISQKKLKKLEACSELIGEWIVWNDEKGTEIGIPLDAWRLIYDQSK